MINSTVTISKPGGSPEQIKAGLIASLEEDGVAACEVTLESVDVAAMRFSVCCEDTEENYRQIVALCGKLNTTRGGKSLVQVQSDTFQIAGSEGQFAKDHPPPEGAK